jgi:hypothetical protein
MNTTGSAALESATYAQRSNSRMLDLEQLIEELAGLHPLLDRDLAPIEAIGTRLRQLADTQRAEIVKDDAYQTHKVWLWRRIDLYARLVQDLLSSGGWARDSLEAEDQELRSQPQQATDYDRALMALSGEPLPESTPRKKTTFVLPNGLLTSALIGIGITAIAVVLVMNGVYLAGAAVAIYLLRVIHKFQYILFPARGELTQFASVPDPDTFCPGVSTYWAFINPETERLSKRTFVTDWTVTTDIYEAMSDTLNSLSKLRQVTPPTAARDVHTVQIACSEALVAALQAVLDGANSGDALKRLHALIEDLNASLNSLNARCSG